MNRLRPSLLLAAALLSAPVCADAGVPVVSYKTGKFQASPADSASGSFGFLPAAGSHILVGVTQWNSDSSVNCIQGSVSDNQGNTYQLIASAGGAPTHLTRVYAYLAEAIPTPSGQFTVTVNCVDDRDYLTADAWAITGALPGAIVDRIGTASTTGTSITVSTGGSTAQSDELLVALLGADNNGTLTYSIESGWTSQTTETQTTGSGGEGAHFITKGVSSPGTYSHTWTVGTNNETPALAAILLSLRGTVAGQIALTWRDNSSDETLFRIQKRTDQSSPNWLDLATVGANVTSYTFALPVGETGDCERVRAENSGGVSAWSNEACVTTAPPPPPEPVSTGVGGWNFAIDPDLF
ncbi:MAG: fibronectin type III domain-containing protein [Nitrospiraceae bacterium]